MRLLFILTKIASIRATSGFDSEPMFDEAFAGRVFV